MNLTFNKKTKIINKLIFIIGIGLSPKKSRKLFHIKSKTNPKNQLLNKLIGYKSYLI